MVKLNQISSQYLTKIMYTLLSMTILETLTVFAIALFFSPSISTGAENASVFTDIQNQILSVCASFTIFFVILSFQFGFSIMLLQMSRRKNTNLGYIFMGFSKINPAGKVTAAFSVIFVLIALVCRILAALIFIKFDLSFLSDKIFASFSEFSKNSPISFTAQDFDSFVITGIASLFFILISFLVTIRFVFVFPLHFDNPTEKITGVFKKSFQMTKKNVLRLVAFALRAGGKSLLIALFLFIILILIPDEKNSALAVLVLLLNLAYFVNLYTALVRIYLTVPVMYEAIINPENEIKPQISTDENS